MMSNFTFQLTHAQLDEFARAAGRAGGESVLEEMSTRYDSALKLIERSGAHKAVLSTAEAATYAGVTPGTIRTWIRDGMLATKLGGRAGYRIRKTDIDDWRTTNGPPPAVMSEGP